MPARPATVPAASVGALSGWLRSGIAWSAIASLAIVWFVWFALGGGAYYTAPFATRAYTPGHPLFRPSGPIGQTLGMAGALLMLMPFAYMARKRFSGLRSVGNLRSWLELHLFCGIVGPVLITLHTSFKFNGIVSAAYWSMVIVVLSGFVGRYLYVRIPRSIRGTELTRGELDARAESLKLRIAESVPSMELFRRVEDFETASVPDPARVSIANLFLGDVGQRRRQRRFLRELREAGLSVALARDIVKLTAERATLLRRVAYLQKTKTLFGLWHVLHLPLVYLLLVIVAVHVGITLYMGYVPFRW